MKRFIEGESRAQATLFPERLDDWIAEDNPVRAVDAFVDELDLAKLGFEGAEPAATGRPAYHPGTLLKIYIYGYLNRLPSSRRLERESQRNIELLWLLHRVSPDHKTIAEFRRRNKKALAQVLRQLSALHDLLTRIARSVRIGNIVSRHAHARLGDAQQRDHGALPIGCQHGSGSGFPDFHRSAIPGRPGQRRAADGKCLHAGNRHR